MRGPMPVRPAAAAALLLAACATPPAAPEPEGADRLDAEVARQVRAGRDQGYPDLADVPTPEASGRSVRALAADGEALAAEAEALRALRDAAAEDRPGGDLGQRAEAIKRDIRAKRAEIDAQPPIERPEPR